MNLSTSANATISSRSEEHTSELQSHHDLVCRLLLEKKKINPDTNKIPKHLFQGYLNIYNNSFKAPWMPDRTEANPNELNQDDARYGFRCCHLKNIWTAPLPPETELSRQIFFFTTSAATEIYTLSLHDALPI